MRMGHVTAPYRRYAGPTLEDGFLLTLSACPASINMSEISASDRTEQTRPLAFVSAQAS